MRWVVGLLLVGAALLKAVEFSVEPATAWISPLGRFVVAIQIGAELGIGALALLGVHWRRVRWLALVLFGGFAAYSLYLAKTGAASCGCFGAIEVHPWSTLA